LIRFAGVGAAILSRFAAPMRVSSCPLSAGLALQAESAGGNCHGREIFKGVFVIDCQTAETTELLRCWGRGDTSALDRLTPRVYRELRRIAGRLMQYEGPAPTMQATALVHEAYLRMVDITNVEWQHRAQFFVLSARIMRNVLLDRARARAAAKRGGGRARVNLDEIPDLAAGRASELIALDDALNALAAIDGRRAQVIELRHFGGLSVEETAAVLKVSPETVMRDARVAQAWLKRELRGSACGPK
jgi:RNA polymerase sigma factor (TIGR02999 family)